MMSQSLARFLVLGCLLLMAGFAWWPKASSSGDGLLTVRFLDVGQGDAIHITTPDGVEVLIDGGSSAGILRELAHGRSWLDRDIDVLIATHPDTDHVGGLVDVLRRYEIGVILETVAEADSPAAESYATAAASEGAQRIIAQRGQQFTLGASTTLTVYAPWGDTYNWRSNNASIITKISFGNIDFLLTGDASKETEDVLVRAYGTGLEAEVLKLGHHGSDTSTSDLFLDAVTPEYAVVSAGANNQYGHPHEAVLKRVSARDITTVSTAEAGTVTFKSDGVRVWVE